MYIMNRSGVAARTAMNVLSSLRTPECHCSLTTCMTVMSV